MDASDDIEDWASDSKRENSLLFSELDVLLRALDRFFTVENLAAPSEDLTSKNFCEELVAARDVILRILSILEAVIPEGRRNAYWFQKFAEAKLLTVPKQDAVRQSLYRQDTHEKGLYLLYDSFINLKGVISDLGRTGSISYMGFMNIGRIVSKEIHGNMFFNPFNRDINPDFDMITSPQISELVRSIRNRETKKDISMIYVCLFRFLRFLGFVDIETQRTISLNCSLVILILLRSEMEIVQGLIEKAALKVTDNALRTLLKSITYQFSMETRRVYGIELKDIHRNRASLRMRGKIENCHGILRNMIQHSIVHLTQHFSPDIMGEDIFPSFITQLQRSLLLREDLIALHRFISELAAGARSPLRQRLFESLRNYMVYFESFTFRLLRYDDYEEFVRFFQEINAVGKEMVAGSEFQKVMKKIDQFRIFLETTMRQIENREGLSGRPVDLERVGYLVKQYVWSSAL